MLNIDPAKLLIIAVVAVILLGPDRLPQVARQIGGVWRSFTDYRHRMETQVRNSMPDLPSSSEIARLARSPSALLNHLSTMDSPGEAASDSSDQSGETGDVVVPTAPVVEPVLLTRPPVLRAPMPQASTPQPEPVHQSDPSMN